MRKDPVGDSKLTESQVYEQNHVVGVDSLETSSTGVATPPKKKKIGTENPPLATRHRSSIGVNGCP